MSQAMNANQWICAALRGEAPDWKLLEPGISPETLWESIAANGVIALLCHALSPTPAWQTLPESLRTDLDRLTKNQAAAELMFHHELGKVLGAMGGNGIDCLLMKGAPLAYTLYPQAYLRSRCDTDLLFPGREAAEQAWRLFEAMGYERPDAVSGELVSHEFCCHRSDRSGIGHTLDLHWKLSNVHFYASRFDYDALAASAIGVDRLAPQARALGPVHALLLACMHRIAHKPEGQHNRLIWLYDIHLLCAHFSAHDWEVFTHLATQRQLCAICLDGLRETRDRFLTKIPRPVIAHLEEHAGDEKHGPDSGASPIRMEWSNLRALPTWSKRVALIRERLLPDGEYMLRKYGATNRLLLPWLYLRRAVEGVFKILKRH